MSPLVDCELPLNAIFVDLPAERHHILPLGFPNANDNRIDIH